MKKMLFFIICIVALGAVYLLVSVPDQPLVTKDTVVPPVTTTNPTKISATSTNINNSDTSKKEPHGEFVGKAHEVSGSVVVTNASQGKVLHLENFANTNGPDLFVYLATDDTAKDFITLGKIKSIQGTSDYRIPLGTDISKYSHVLIWCKSFSVLFGMATLK